MLKDMKKVGRPVQGISIMKWIKKLDKILFYKNKVKFLYLVFIFQIFKSHI